MENNIVEVLLDFCDVDFDFLGCYLVVCVLKILCCLEYVVCDRFVFLNVFLKIGNLILKDNC